MQWPGQDLPLQPSVNSFLVALHSMLKYYLIYIQLWFCVYPGASISTIDVLLFKKIMYPAFLNNLQKWNWNYLGITLLAIS